MVCELPPLASGGHATKFDNRRAESCMARSSRHGNDTPYTEYNYGASPASSRILSWRLAECVPFQSTETEPSKFVASEMSQPARPGRETGRASRHSEEDTDRNVSSIPISQTTGGMRHSRTRHRKVRRGICSGRLCRPAARSSRFRRERKFPRVKTWIYMFKLLTGGAPSRSWRIPAFPRTRSDAAFPGRVHASTRVKGANPHPVTAFTASVAFAARQQPHRAVVR